jgi:hypothetical protein
MFSSFLHRNGEIELRARLRAMILLQELCIHQANELGYHSLASILVGSLQTMSRSVDAIPCHSIADHEAAQRFNATLARLLEVSGSSEALK